MADPRDVSVSKLLSKIVCALVDRPESVEVEEMSQHGNTVHVEVRVAQGDVGKVIGKQGRNAKSLRIIVSAVGQKLHRRCVLVIDEGNLG